MKRAHSGSRRATFESFGDYVKNRDYYWQLDKICDCIFGQSAVVDYKTREVSVYSFGGLIVERFNLEREVLKKAGLKLPGGCSTAHERMQFERILGVLGQ